VVDAGFGGGDCFGGFAGRAKNVRAVDAGSRWSIKNPGLIGGRDFYGWAGLKLQVDKRVAHHHFVGLLFQQQGVTACDVIQMT
jgi:hypothetical protein